jgi:hypothetical protein
VVWATPAGPKPIPECEGFAPDILDWLLGPPGLPKPQKSTVYSRPNNYIRKNPSVGLRGLPPSSPSPLPGPEATAGKKVSRPSRSGLVWVLGHGSPPDPGLYTSCEHKQGSGGKPTCCEKASKMELLAGAAGCTGGRKAARRRGGV